MAMIILPFAVHSAHRRASVKFASAVPLPQSENPNEVAQEVLARLQKIETLFSESGAYPLTLRRNYDFQRPGEDTGFQTTWEVVRRSLEELKRVQKKYPPSNKVAAYSLVGRRSAKIHQCIQERWSLAALHMIYKGFTPYQAKSTLLVLRKPLQTQPKGVVPPRVILDALQRRAQGKSGPSLWFEILHPRLYAAFKTVSQSLH